MNKYLRIDWLEYQKYQDREDFDDIFDVCSSGEYAYISEEDYQDLTYPKEEYPKTVISDVGGEITIWDLYADYQGKRFWKHSSISKGDLVMFYSDEKGYWVVFERIQVTYIDENNAEHRVKIS